MNDAQHLADRYVSVWNEADPDRRRQAIAEIWRPDGQHYVDVREARGYDALEQRIVGSYERNIRDGRHRFRSAPGALGLRDLVVVPWEMMVADSERKVASGVAILIVDSEGRIRTDYQFVTERKPPSV
jgi:hypothetical protein